MAEEVIGNYRLMKPMWTGQDSQVFEVVESNSGRHFAMKILLPEKTDRVDLRNFLLHEAEVGLKLTHPNIIRIAHVAKNPANPYFVMDFFPGGSLKSRIQAAPKEPKQRDFLREKGQDILKQWATALAFMNAKGYVHRDVKPDNVLVNSAGETRVIDFAIAQKIVTGMGKMFRRREAKAAGTPSYMSPEQIRRDAVDGRADIYSFAASAYELATGRPPFRAQSTADLLNKHLVEKPISPREYNSEVGKEFAEFILQMLSKRKEERPRNFHEVLMKMRTIRLFIPPPPQRKPKPTEPTA